MTLLNSITTELLARNGIDEAKAQKLCKIKVEQHCSRKIAELLIDYPSLKDELLEKAPSAGIQLVKLTIDTSSRRPKPFWSFKQDGIALLVVNGQH